MDEDRVQRIEESISFAEQRADELDEAVRDIADRLLQMVRRLERLESRLSVLEQPGEAGEPDAADERPPHSGRLPGDR